MSKNLVTTEMFLFQPWIFWALILSTHNIGALIGISIIVAIAILLYTFLPSGYKWIGVLLFLSWIGPILFILPFFLILFVIPNVMTGEWNVPIGCVRNYETGKLDCI